MLQVTDLPSDPNGHTSPIKRAGVQLINQCKHYPKKRKAVIVMLEAFLGALQAQDAASSTDVPSEAKEATEDAPVKAKATSTKKKRATAKVTGE